MGEDTKNTDGMLKDTYPEKKKGWTESAGELISKIVANLHDRGVFVTEKRKQAMEDAASEPYNSEEVAKKNLGFKKANVTK